MNKNRLAAVLVPLLLILGGCGQQNPAVGSRTSEITDNEAADITEQTEEAGDAEKAMEMTDNEIVTDGRFPEELALIPQGYFTEAEKQGTLVELSYDTFESMTYAQESTVLHKRAIVYLPYGYSEDMQYNVFYLMHDGSFAIEYFYNGLCWIWKGRGL